MFINYLTDATTERFVYNGNIEIRPTDDSNKITTDLCNTLLHRY